MARAEWHTTNRGIPGRRGRAMLLCAVLICAPGTGAAADPGNPHWRANGCPACHATTQPRAGAARLAAASAAALCAQCHDDRTAPGCRHRSAIMPGAARREQFDTALQAALVDGRVNCTTCHDLAPHCARDPGQRYRNAAFLRGGPFEDPAEQCFGCHRKSAYRRSTPHMHVRKGEIQADKCVFCHGSVPQRDADGPWLPVTFATQAPLSKLCDGCHVTGPHPSGPAIGASGWVHLVVPPAAYRERMARSVAERGGALPLDPRTGAIGCATCHNPHHSGLEGYPTSGEKAPARLRYAAICGVCHEI